VRQVDRGPGHGHPLLSLRRITRTAGPEAPPIALNGVASPAAARAGSVIWCFVILGKGRPELRHLLLHESDVCTPAVRVAITEVVLNG
jgi:hypothetical protein